jgi:hypothetical protein
MPPRKKAKTKHQRMRQKIRAKYYARKKQDPAWLIASRKKSREAMRRLSERRAWLKLELRGGLRGAQGYTVVSAKELKNPRLKWLDSHGVLHEETERSAEELISEWQRSQKKNARA